MRSSKSSNGKAKRRLGYRPLVSLDELQRKDVGGWTLRAWDVFGQANGTRDEHELLVRLDRLGGRDTLGLGRGRDDRLRRHH